MPQVDDIQKQLQQSIDTLRGQIDKRWGLINQLAAHREAQERSFAELRELIMGMSVQVMQLINQTHDGAANGEEDIMQHNFCSENHPLIDASQVFDESPKRNTHINSDDWFGEGQGKLSGNSNHPAVAMRFGSKPCDDPLAELMKLRQFGSVEQYQENFDSLFTISELPVSYGVSCFISGLKDEIQTVVRMFNPQTLHDTYCLAKLQEATLASIARKTTPTLERPPSSLRTAPQYSKARPIVESHPSHVNDIGSQSKAVPPVGLGPQRASSTAYSFTGCSLSPRTNLGTFKPELGRGTLSLKEIVEDRARNLCFFYDEKHIPGQKRGAQVYSLGILEEHGEDEEEHEAVEEEAKGGLNPPNRLFEKSISSTHAKVTSTAQQEQQENHGWKWANCFCFIVFDPGGTLPLSKGLLPVFHTIHNLEAVSVVFDPGGNIVTTIFSRYIGPSPSELGYVPDVDELGMITAEPMAILARKLEKKGNKAVVYLLVQWSNKPKEEATWELYTIQTLKQGSILPAWKLEAKLPEGEAMIQKMEILKIT